MDCIIAMVFTLFAGWIVYGIYLLEVDRDKAKAKRKGETKWAMKE